MVMSGWSNPRLGMEPGIRSNSTVSSVRLSSRKRSCPLARSVGRQMALKPVPPQVPSSPARSPRSIGAGGGAGPGGGEGLGLYAKSGARSLG
jgi:hypothetical protein